jgi:hypothetical protein
VDVDERRGRWRVRAAVAKTGAARWVTPPPRLFAAVYGELVTTARTYTHVLGDEAELDRV